MPHGVEPPGSGGWPERAGPERSYVDGHHDGSKEIVMLPQSIIMRNRRTLDTTKNGLLDTDQHNLIWIEDLTSIGFILCHFACLKAASGRDRRELHQRS